jgi:replicative DNA helicase
LVIDYLQLMHGEGPNRNAEIEGITRGLKALAMELDIGIVLLSQLNRELEKRPNKRPLPSDLRDSGAIEQDCDAILFVYRDEVYHPDTPDRGIAEIIIGAGRQVDRGTVALQYVGERTKFQSLAKGQTFGVRPAPKGARYSLMDE